MSEAYIYALKDPRTGEIRYIGQTRNLKTRLREHTIGGAVNQRFGAWRRELALLNYHPKMSVLDIVPV